MPVMGSASQQGAAPRAREARDAFPWRRDPGSAVTAAAVRARGGQRVGFLWRGCPVPENQVPREPASHAILRPRWPPSSDQEAPCSGQGPGTHPECAQGVVGGVGLLSAAPVHQPLQLDQEELLGSGGRGRSLRAEPASGWPWAGVSSEPRGPGGRPRASEPPIQAGILPPVPSSWCRGKVS